MRSIRTLFAAAALLGTAACASTPIAAAVSSVRLLVQPATVAAGDATTLVLVNGTAGDVGYNLCTSGLERREGSAWRVVPSDRMCTMELRTLEPGGEARFRLEMPASLAAGDYRAVTRVELTARNEMLTVTSDPFQVTAR